ncbi:MAG: hypothetical protein RLZZ515_1428 [Cyanobacteriota bacterium]|jgi:hypothetical protein
MAGQNNPQLRPLYIDRINNRFLADPIGAGPYPVVPIVPGMFAPMGANTVLGSYGVTGVPGPLSSDVVIDLVNTATSSVINAARLPAGSTSALGVLQLTNATNSTSTTTAATPNSVKSAYDLAQTGVTDAATAQGTANTALTTANAALPRTGGTMIGAITFAGAQPTATTSAAAIVQLSSSTNSTSETLAATPKAVKDAYDIGNTALTGTGPLAGFRNAIINGDFNVWQRANSSSAFGYVAADRWVNGFTGSSSTMSRQSFALGQTEVPGEPQFFCRIVATSVTAGANYVALAQRIEGVRTCAGQTITLSFWAKANAARSIAVDFTQNFGTGGTPSAEVTGIGVTKVAIGTTWQKVTTTVTLPSISGKTLGTDGNDRVILTIFVDAGSSFNSRTNTLGHQSGTFDFARVQIEPGATATAFEERPLALEERLCHRYFRRFSYYGGAFSGANVAYFTPEGIGLLRTTAPTIAVTAQGFQFYNGTAWASTGSATFDVYLSPTSGPPVGIRASGLTGNGTLSTPTACVVEGSLSAEI